MPDEIFVLAFDPGETTGWCVIGVDTDTLHGARHANDKLNTKLTTFRYGQIQCFGPTAGWTSMEAAVENDAVDQMLNLANEYNPCCIVFEDFILDPNKAVMTRSMLSPVTVMAKFEFGLQYVRDCGDGSLASMFRLNRSTVKTTFTDVRLKNLGINVDGGHANRHARDAARYAYYFLRDARGASIKAKESRWRAWPQYFADPIVQEIVNNNHYRKQEDKQKRKGTRIGRLG